MSQEKINQHRETIDAIDEEVLALLNKRAEQARAIGQLKSGNIAHRPEREAQILERIKSLNHGPLPNETILYLFREIMSANLALQKPLAIAYLGPAGTFSEAAAQKHFGHASQLVPCESIDHIFRTVESGQTDYAIAPIENSIEGPVQATCENLIHSSLHINGEVKLSIQQNLLRSTNSLDNIKKVYGHPQSLGQCRNWLQNHLPQAEKIPVSSNAKGAEIAAKENESAAIAGENAAKLYHLEIVCPDIADEAQNTTRFIALGKHATPPSGKDKTSILAGIENAPGAIANLLKPLSKSKTNILRFISHPDRTNLWEYFFFIDFEGHHDEKNVRQVLKEIKENTVFLKVLGSYPISIL